MTTNTSIRPRSNADKQDGSGIALLFPGQGSQHRGMGKQAFEASPAARKVFQEADEVLQFGVSELCFEGSEEELADTVNTQPAILTTSVAYLAHLRELIEKKGRELRPSLMAGHSMGQFTAAVAANSIDFSDGLKLVLERGRIMADWAKKQPGGLVTILGMKEDDIREVCADAELEGQVGIAVRNGPGQTVISGPDGPLQKAMALAKERGARVMRLPISVPGHTPLMRDAARELSKFMSSLPFRDPDPPLVSNISAKLLTTADEVRAELADQICLAVEWARCVVAMANEGAGSFVDVGPGHALSNMVRRIRGDAQVFGAEQVQPEDLKKLADADPRR